jgi:hypothetical protein
MKPAAVCLEPRWVLCVELSWFEYMHSSDELDVCGRSWGAEGWLRQRRLPFYLRLFVVRWRAEPRTRVKTIAHAPTHAARMASPLPSPASPKRPNAGRPPPSPLNPDAPLPDTSAPSASLSPTPPPDGRRKSSTARDLLRKHYGLGLGGAASSRQHPAGKDAADPMDLGGCDRRRVLASLRPS